MWFLSFFHDIGVIWNFSFPFSHAAAYAKTDASTEAVKLMRDVFGYYSYSGELTAAFTVPKPKPKPTIRNLKTVKGGMEKIPKSLMEQFLGASNR